MTRTLRSLLFVPGNRPERFSKAHDSGADAVILDLEDAVALDQKDNARNAVASALDPLRPVVVRINAPGTPWFADDLALVSHPGVAAVMLPKAERVDEIHALAAAGCTNVLALIESAAGLECARMIARAKPVTRLVFGSIDFQLDLGISGDAEELLLFRSELVLASRLAGISRPVDGVCTALSESDVVIAEALRASRLGFSGKLCIHPRQVQMVNEAFTPSQEAIAWAQSVLDASAAANGAAVAVDGKMVDRPVILRAEAILAEAGPEPA